MPSTCQSLRDWGILMVLGSMRTMMIAAFAMARALAAGSLLRSWMLSGAALTSSPTTMSAALILLYVTSVTRWTPSAQIVVSIVAARVPGPGPVSYTHLTLPTIYSV